MRRIAGWLLAVGVMVVAGTGPAFAQAVGDPFPFDYFVTPDGRYLSITGQCQMDDELADNAMLLGGATLFASTSPGGPVLAAVPLPKPGPGYEFQYCPGFSLNGPPPGTYYVLMVYGLTSTHSAPPSAWRPVVVASRCTNAPPLPPQVPPGMPNIGGNTLNLAFTGNITGCATNRIDLEVGTTPGGKDVGVFQLPGFGIFAPNVPAGTYYARARGVNAAGPGQPSEEVPLSIPNHCLPGSGPLRPLNPVATVNGHTVTVSWGLSPVANPPQPTFLQIAVFDPNSQVVLDHLILPPMPQLVVTGVPSGEYRIGIAPGNACSLAPMVPNMYLDFVVP